MSDMEESFCFGSVVQPAFMNEMVASKTTFHRPPAGGHGTVVFAIVTTIPCFGLFTKPSNSSELFELIAAGTVECRNYALF